jgi:hypothetical protein
MKPHRIYINGSWCFRYQGETLHWWKKVLLRVVGWKIVELDGDGPLAKEISKS